VDTKLDSQRVIKGIQSLKDDILSEVGFHRLICQDILEDAVVEEEEKVFPHLVCHVIYRFVEVWRRKHFVTHSSGHKQVVVCHQVEKPIPEFQIMSIQ